MSDDSHEASGGAAVKALIETDKALCVELPDGARKWIPKSVIHDDSEVWKYGDEGVLVVKTWWAEREGLE